MDSLRTLFRIGTGPSSSHTMGPRIAAERFRNRVPGATSFRVTLLGSMAATGKGHLTDEALHQALAPAPVEIVWRPEVVPAFHPNGLRFQALDGEGAVMDEWTVYSVGGGSIAEEGMSFENDDIYPLTSMSEILRWADGAGKKLSDYVFEYEGEDIWRFLEMVWRTMETAIGRGLETEGALPGILRLQRKAATLHARAQDTRGFVGEANLVYAYALAVAEENAAGGVVVTAPTCGSAGVVPAVLKFLRESRNISHERLLRALATAGLVGLIVKTNGSISGAEVGCQGEVGTASAMAAAAAAQILGGSNYQVEYAAEMALEHNLGLTCDPVAGLVQIPCIERNAIAAMKALSCAAFAVLSDGRHRVTFDTAVETMLRTGRDLAASYRETSEGGLAGSVSVS